MKKLVVAALTIISIYLISSFRESLLDAGYGYSPSTAIAANVLSLSLAAAIIISYRLGGQLIMALSAAYALLEITLLPEPSLPRLLAMTLTLYVLALTRSDVPLRGLKHLTLATPAYAVFVILFLAVLVALDRLSAAPLSLLEGDSAVLYSYLHPTRAWKYILFVALLAAIPRLVLNIIELVLSVKYKRVYASHLVSHEVVSAGKELSKPLSGAESLALWMASSLTSILIATLLFEVITVRPVITLLDAAIFTAFFAAVSVALKVYLGSALSGNFGRIALMSSALLTVMLYLWGPGPLMEALGLGPGADKDPLAYIAAPELGVSVDTSLQRMDTIARVIVNLFWGG